MINDPNWAKERFSYEAAIYFEREYATLVETGAVERLGTPEAPDWADAMEQRAARDGLGVELAIQCDVDWYYHHATVLVSISCNGKDCPKTIPRTELVAREWYEWPHSHDDSSGYEYLCKECGDTFYAALLPLTYRDIHNM
jgi:hypothetical protein